MGSSEIACSFIFICAMLTSLWVVYRTYTFKFSSDIKLLQDELVELRKELEWNNRHTQISNSLEPLPVNCGEAVNRSEGHQSGVYQMQLPSGRPFRAYCLLDRQNIGPAWTVVQRRQDGSTNFDRKWADYKRGFGDLEGEYFLGLDMLHELTKFQRHELWMQVTKFTGEPADERYDSVVIGDEQSQYVLRLGKPGEDDTPIRMYSSRNQKFSTSDVDPSGRNCAKFGRGGWWHSFCEVFVYSRSNLNGRYRIGTGMSGRWINVHMAIRPITLVENP